MSDCFFCKIAKGDIPTNTVYEDDNFRVILDIAPANPGHCLIIPKKHSPNIYETDDDVLAKAMVLAKKMAVKVKKATGCDGVNIMQNNEEAAGQTVFHFHMHIIPRYKDDNVLSYNTKKQTDEEFAQMRQKLADL